MTDHQIGLFLSGVVGSLANHWHLYFAQRCGQRMRAVSIALVYRHAVRQTLADRGHRTVGEICNLMSNDTQKFFGQCRATAGGRVWRRVDTTVWPLRCVLCKLFVWFSMSLPRRRHVRMQSFPLPACLIAVSTLPLFIRALLLRQMCCRTVSAY